MTDPRQPARDLYWRDRDRGSYRCPGCDRSRDEVGQWHVHHLDGNKHNASDSNTVALCPRCHLGEQHGQSVDDRHLQPPKPVGVGKPKPQIGGPP
jgi:hypothetical protein